MKKYWMNVLALVLLIFTVQLYNNVALAQDYEVKGEIAFPFDWKPLIKDANGQVTVVDVDDKYKLLIKEEFTGPTNSNELFNFSAKPIEESKINFSHTYRCVVLLHVNQADNKYSQYWGRVNFQFKKDVPVKDLGIVLLEIVEIK